MSNSGSISEIFSAFKSGEIVADVAEKRLMQEAGLMRSDAKVFVERWEKAKQECF